MLVSNNSHLTEPVNSHVHTQQPHETPARKGINCTRSVQNSCSISSLYVLLQSAYYAYCIFVEMNHQKEIFFKIHNFINSKHCYFTDSLLTSTLLKQTHPILFSMQNFLKKWTP